MGSIVKKISIVVACYNEQDNIVKLAQRVRNVMTTLPQYNYELIFVDNASVDSSRSEFEKIIEIDPHVSVLIMSRNFGSNQPSLLAGMTIASGDCMISIDGDLQDPPELIPQFVKTWEEGYDVVYGVRTKRKGSILRRIGYKVFYRIFRTLSYLDIPLDAGDTCLIDRKIMNIITSLPEKDLYIRGLRTWAGFKQTGIEYVREDREAGISSNSFFANFSWAKKAIVNFSYKPLEFISRIAAIAVGITCIAACVYLYWHFKYGAPRGFSTLLMVMFIFGTIQLLALSVIGEYLIRIFQEVKGRPPYIIREILHQKNSSRNPFIHHVKDVSYHGALNSQNQLCTMCHNHTQNNI
jgi:polyisoprenyl-phosphate glycosyltransferase